MYLLMFVLNVVLIPATMLGFGFRWVKNPPKNINMIFGYRSTWSMKSQETWDFAHQYTGRLWVIIGIPVTIISIIAWLSGGFMGPGALVTSGIQLLGLLSPIIPTELALRKHFDKDGKYIG